MPDNTETIVRNLASSHIRRSNSQNAFSGHLSGQPTYVDDHFFNPACQLSTTVMGAVRVCPTGMVARNFLPSGEMS
jgi:hypothetical protein